MDHEEQAMSARLEQHRDIIEQLRREGRSVRAIATALSDMTGERCAPSSVHQFLKVQQLPLSANGNGGFNGNGNANHESNAPVLEDSVQVRLDSFDKTLTDVVTHQGQVLAELRKQRNRLGSWIGCAGLVVWCDFVWTIRFDLATIWKIGIGLVTGLVLGWFLSQRQRGRA